MSNYLEEAAALLRKAAAENEKCRQRDHGTAVERMAADQRIASGFARLAAIERGLIPSEMVAELLAQVVRPEARR